MSIRVTVQELLSLGELPESARAEEQSLDRWIAALNAINPPVTDEEALALAELFGPDECFGVAWSLLHLIETAPGHPQPREEVFKRSAWLRTVWSERSGL